MPIIASSVRQTVKDYNDVMTFGKHSGKTVDWIADNEPSYIVWLDDEGIVKFPDFILEDAIESEMESYRYFDCYDEPF